MLQRYATMRRTIGAVIHRMLRILFHEALSRNDFYKTDLWKQAANAVLDKNRSARNEGQAMKSAGWMPWH